MMHHDGTIPDQADRNLVFSELDSNILVEASAGTGKTTSIVGRMLALLRSGKCKSIRNMAAVTFTRKAAAEMRSRFQIELEKALREATGEERGRLEKALAQQEECFIGTIHSFCARLLRERPVEAGVDLAFKEIEEEADLRIREDAWNSFSASMLENDREGLLAKLHTLGLRLSNLKRAFFDFADFPDVDEWPLPDPEDIDINLEAARQELESYVGHMEKLAPLLPSKVGNDKLIPEFVNLPRVISHYQLELPVQLMEVLGLFDKEAKIVQAVWKENGNFTGDDAKKEKERWDNFRRDVVLPNLGAWRMKRYAAIMPLMFLAREDYDARREHEGVLNFQDLLMKAARLLRDNPSVRRYLQSRFTHLMVDEFQDTDPIQAEVIVLLASTNPVEINWRDTLPRPGSLFVVGDPKQSIYRFRRADITTYNEVKGIIESNGGLVVKLQANFRANPDLLEWTNSVFDPGESLSNPPEFSRFPREESAESPSYIPLLSGREDRQEGRPCGIMRLEIPEFCTKKEDVAAFEADMIARTIKGSLDAQSRPSDFMIIPHKKESLPAYARALRQYGIPCQVAGGAGLGEIRELKLLNLCLRTIARPDDPVALVTLLRSELFGFSDDVLYSYKKAGGTFSFQASPADGLSPDIAELFEDAFGRLRSYHLLTFRMPLVAAIEIMAGDLGISALASCEPGGNAAAGGLAKALELLRRAWGEMWNIQQAVEYVQKLIDGKEEHNAGPIFSDDNCVRILNLHKAKGLEAPVVFLAYPYGASRHEIRRHIDRSGDKVLGYLALTSEGNAYGRGGELLAHPAGWEQLEEREKGFLQAEELRLAYVAATRSGRATIISQRMKSNHHNPWRRFDAHLPPESGLPDPGPQDIATIKSPNISLEAMTEAGKAIAQRLRECLEPGCLVSGAKDFAHSREPTSPEAIIEDLPVAVEGETDFHGEKGVLFGEIIHTLIEAAMNSGSSPSEEMVVNALADKGLARESSPFVVRMLERAMASGLWERAASSSKRFTEVPFHMILEGEEPPRLIRGAIDLAFREPDGWVLADYKTDQIGGKSLDGILDRYRPQMEFYAEAWEKCSGEAVKERLIYFLEAGVIARV